MVVRKTKNISTQSIRKCRFYLNYFLTRGIQIPIINSDDPNELCNALNDALDRNTSYKREEFIEVIELHCSEQLLLISNFDWLENNDRACYWLWVAIRTTTYRELADAPAPQKITDNNLMYDGLNLNAMPSSTQERYNCIVGFFDSWQSNSDNKTSFLENKRSEWSHIFSSQKAFKWLNDDDEQQCHWAWSHLLKEQIPTWFINAANTKELYHAIFAVFDAWQATSDRKELFLIRINKAWSQKKYRDNLEGKKPLNTYLNEETKHKLDMLSVKHRRKIHEMLEDIITDAYERDKNTN